ncbi:hypothetical protein [Paraburkholderia bryophila]|uniref:hypothetical protein n=1 Tax=Paraburkholderia bryophila TaxID=420952 RepID=UPI000DD045A6|nr:hypothetical protein [Paraburkholderia bryophila]
MADFENPAMLAPAGVGRRHRHVAVDDLVVKERDAGERATGTARLLHPMRGIRCAATQAIFCALRRFDFVQ